MPSSQLSPQGTDISTYVLCSWDIAICLSLFLQGVLCGQFAHYTNMRKCDSMKLKVYVAGLALLTTLNVVQSLAMMWIQNVTLFGNLEAASKMWKTNWVTKLTIPFEGVIAFYVQMFYCHRLWLLCRKPCIVVTCTVVFTFGLVACLLATFFILTNELPPVSWSASFNAWRFSLNNDHSDNASGSGVWRGSFFDWEYAILVTTLKEVHSFAWPDGNHPQSSIQADKSQSAGPCAICALVTFIASMRTHFLAPVPMMIEFIAITVLPQLYAWSAMWTLNSREDISLAAEKSLYTIDLETSGVADGSSDAGTLHVHEPFEVADPGDQESIDSVGKIENSHSNGSVV
ncbi:hypothetical protein C8R45DRAFT_1096842 [Mycena sanguinolenta]|nr:hypothetical protein C8R45DRAFT_1096842 [Mycena sanguinolenta]